MGFTLKVEGPELIELGIESITTVKFSSDIPLDSNARSKDLGSTVTMTGKILTAVDGADPDATRKIGLWSLVPAERADCYRRATVEVINVDQVVRKFFYPNAFCVDYIESYDDSEGIGTFTLIFKQKKDKMDYITVEGGYGVVAPR
jgi:hypothetical protein